MTTQPTTGTQMIVIGSHALTRGFRLIGFDAMVNPDSEEVHKRINDLMKQQQRAFLVVEQYIANKLRDVFSPIQQEGGDILMVELPSIHEPDRLESFLSERIEQHFGSTMQNRNEHE